MKVLVFGAGSIGSWIGAALSRRHDVTLVGRRAHVAAIHRGGLALEGLTAGLFHPRAVERVEDAPRDAAWAVVTVKAHDTGEACVRLRAHLPPEARVLTLQNGLGNLELVEAAFGARRAFAGITSHGVTWLGPGRVRHAGAGDLVLGPSDPRELPRATELAAAFSAAGLPARAAPGIRGELWGKAIVNAAINPLTALHRCTNGRLLEDPALRAEMEAAAGEAREVAAAAGIALPPGDWVEKAREVARRTAENRSSMLQSVAAGKRTEIEAITGAIVAEARRRGVPVPVNESLLARVRALGGGSGPEEI